MILVFKTNVRNKKQIEKLSNHFKKITAITKWNFDLSDVDKILRIESVSNISEKITTTLISDGFHCEELY